MLLMLPEADEDEDDFDADEPNTEGNIVCHKILIQLMWCY